MYITKIWTEIKKKNLKELGVVAPAQEGNWSKEIIFHTLSALFLNLPALSL